MRKELPNATTTEGYLLGACLTGTDDGEQAAYDMAEVLPGPQAFYGHDHRKVAKAIFELMSEGRPVDMVTVCDKMDDHGTLSSVGGRAWVTDLSTRRGSPLHAYDYAQRIREKWLMRRTIDTLKSSYKDARLERSDPHSLLEDTQEKLMKVSIEGEQNDTANIGDVSRSVVSESIELARRKREGKTALTGLPSGYSKINDYTSGWQGGDLVIVGARPSMGKTAYALQEALHLTLNTTGHEDGPFPVSIFSFEMMRKSLVSRLLGNVAKVNMKKAQNGYLSNDEAWRLRTATNKLRDAPIYIHDKPNMSMTELAATARKDQRKRGVQAIFVDYLQLMSENADHERRELEVADISRSLKLLATKTGLVVFGLSQLNRSVENRGGNMMPQMSDLRESGAIEQDADMIMFLRRLQQYDIEEHDLLDCPSEGIADLRIGKQRNGPTGDIHLYFDEEYGRFENFAYTQAQQNQNGDGQLPGDGVAADEVDVSVPGMEEDDDLPI